MASSRLMGLSRIEKIVFDSRGNVKEIILKADTSYYPVYPSYPIDYWRWNPWLERSTVTYTEGTSSSDIQYTFGDVASLTEEL